MITLITLEEARQRMMTAASPVGAARVPLSAAAGRVLAERVTAPNPLPAFDYSAMDGYALRCADWRDPESTLPVLGETKAGDAAGTLTEGSVQRIFTGAPLPANADAVALQEDAVVVEPGCVRLTQRPRPGEHVRRRGEDVAAGQALLEPGTRLNSFQIGLAAALERTELQVHRRPRVTLVSTGSELRLPGSAPRPGSIPESNGYALAAAARGVGAEVEMAPWPGDDPALGAEILGRALAQADLVVTIGGVSVGRYDWVKGCLEDLGVELDFWKLQIKPGKPLAFGRKGSALVLGVPGNPVSAQLTFALLGLPLLRALQGDRRAVATARTATLTEAVSKPPGRRTFFRARLAGHDVSPLPNQASGNSASLALANALIDVAADSCGYPSGATVPVLRLDDL